MRSPIWLLLAFSLLTASCATKRSVTEAYKVVEVHDTLRQLVVQADSVVVRDSVSVWKQGDTIHHDRWRVEYRDRWRDKVREVVKMQTDTLVETKFVKDDGRKTGFPVVGLMFLMVFCVFIIFVRKRVK